MRLNKHEFEEHAPDYPSKTRVNHDSSHCSGSSKSMIVERKEDMSISAKCFRCGAQGYIGGSSYKPSMSRSPFGVRAKKSGKVPNDLSLSWDDFPPEVIVYLNKCGLNESDTNSNGIGFSNKINRLVIPVNNLTRGYAGYITKSFSDDTRYYTNMPDPKYGYHHLLTHDEDAGVLICEDVLSAIRGSKVLSTFSLCGTELTQTAKMELVGHHHKFYLWLDNDNTQVKLKQLKIKNELSLYGEVNLIYSDVEPKHLTDEEIYNIIYT